MKKVNFMFLGLAVLVIVSFLAVAVAIGYRNYMLAGMFTLSGFAIMGFGISRKKRKDG